MGNSLFQSFFMGGFECSSHRLRSGKRLDLLNATQHEQYDNVFADYQRLTRQGIFTIRDGIRWHLIEPTPYHYDFSSVLPLVKAAHATGLQVIWDIFHYGWPDDLDILTPEFIRRFASLASAFASLLADQTDTIPLFAPINEISFVAWGGGDVAYLNPFAHNRGLELKVQLVRAAIEASEAIWAVLPAARIVHIDPLIQIVPKPSSPQAAEAAEAHRLAQYQAWDMLTGRLWPGLGGQARYLDVIGVNYYLHNQWFHEGRTIYRYEHEYKPFRQMLAEVYERYQRPLFVAETGDEGWRRPGWLQYVSGEVRAAIQAGVPVHGLCLYPILNHPGWDNDRNCPNGLWDTANEINQRVIYAPLARELKRQQQLFKQMSTRSALQLQRIESETKKMPLHDRKAATICLFTDSLEPSGLGEHMLALASSLVASYPILFVCPPTSKGEAVLARAAVLGCKTLALEVGDQPIAQHTLGHWLQDLQVEIFHCHAGIGWEGHQGVYVARANHVPIVVRTEHLPYLLTDPAQRQAYHDLVQVVDQIICVSQAAYNSYLEVGIPADKLIMIRNGIVIPAPNRDHVGIRSQLGLPAEAKIILTVARMTEQKGHRYLIEAMPAILSQTPTAYFVWIGEGPLEVELRGQIQNSAIDPAHIIFAGWRNDVPELLVAADLFVLPSLFEGLPLVVLEALAIGPPVIATNVCGTSEAIEDGVNGRLVPARDSAALASAILEALTQPEIGAAWCVVGRQRIDRNFNVLRMVGELVAVYDELVGKAAQATKATQNWLGSQKLSTEYPGSERQTVLQGEHHHIIEN